MSPKYPELVTKVEEKKETKRQKQVDLLENRHDWAAISSLLSMLETDRDRQTAPCISTDTAGAKQHDRPCYLLINTAKVKIKTQFVKHIMD